MINENDQPGDPYADHKSVWSGRENTGIRPSIAAQMDDVLANLDEHLARLTAVD